MPIDHFGPQTASTYDADHADRFGADAVGPAVAVLATLADGRPALEFAIGTGRIALPLQATGVDVDGIDFSAAMIDQLRQKPGHETIATRVGDMATVDMGRRYGLVYLVFNTIGNLMTQEAQVACFRNAARHLEPGGCFVIESNVPDLRRLTPGSQASVFDSTERHVGIDHYTDLAAQQAVSRHFHFDVEPETETDTNANPGDAGASRLGESATMRYGETPFRFTWPSELDLMARLADMHRVERWADWHRAEFTGDSAAHISVWRTN